MEKKLNMKKKQKLKMTVMIMDKGDEEYEEDENK